MTFEDFSKKETQIIDKGQADGRKIAETGLVLGVPPEGKTTTWYLVYF